MSIDWDAELLGPVMSVFGEGGADPATLPLYTPKGGAAFRLIDAVFDEAYHRVVELADGEQGTSQHPVLGVRASIFAQRGLAPRQGDTVFIPSVQQLFVVTDPRPDGHGHILLILIEAKTR